MKLTFLLTACLSLLFALPVSPAEVSPYSGEESRGIKALSEAEIAGLLAGKGMGYAKAAELNGYPGPKQGQVARYMELRGYGDGSHADHAHHDRDG